MMLVALTASSVHEEAMDGFEAIRGALRHPMAQEEERMVSPQISNSVLQRIFLLHLICLKIGAEISVLIYI